MATHSLYSCVRNLPPLHFVTLSTCSQCVLEYAELAIDNIYYTGAIIGGTWGGLIPPIYIVSPQTINKQFTAQFMYFL